MLALESIQPLVSHKEWEAFEKLGITTVQDVLEWFPKRYEDRRRFDAFPSQSGGDPVCLMGVVKDSVRKGFGGRTGVYEVQVEGSGDSVFGGSQITCRWFNMPFIAKVLAAGHEVVLYGKVKDVAGRLVIDHPEFEIVSECEDVSVHLQRIVPVYKLTSGLNQRRLREFVYQLIQQVEAKSLEESYSVDESYPRMEAYRDIHFPETMEAKDAARRRFALEEFFTIQLNVAWRRHHYRRQQGRVMGLKKTLLKQFYENLPFDLTGAQKRSIREIATDMVSPYPMNRMLQGDVGSGKTFVALCAALLAVESGAQVAMMAPTQILAEQHYLGFQKWLEPLGVNVGLCTGNRREGLDQAQIVVGTHALLFGEDVFTDLGLVIVDEQHKFGVDQRSQLIQQGVMPDVLVMTATPIPRTLTLTVYGDLDVSILDERPAGRGMLVSAMRVKPKVTDVTKFIKQQLEQGRQGYIVYPLVEESESLTAESAVVAYEKWVKRLSKYQVGLLHGKIKPEEKDRIMAEFRDGQLDVLVSTTVIEVGVDVPNANIMVINNAERFGLAQLHQLRGRIGRGEHKSYCILLTDGKSETGNQKLEVMVNTNDGFKIAEFDLKMRGPGDVLGTQQSGIGEIRFIEYLSDPTLIREAKSIADLLISNDPELKDHPDLRLVIDQASPKE